MGIIREWGGTTSKVSGENMATTPKEGDPEVTGSPSFGVVTV